MTASTTAAETGRATLGHDPNLNPSRHRCAAEFPHDVERNVSVPVGYLEAVGTVAVYTVSVLKPPRRPAWLAHGVFILTHLVNEAPVIGWGWLIATTAVALTDGELSSAGGIAVLALAIATALGLVVVTRRGLMARGVVDSALQHAFPGSGSGSDRGGFGRQVARVVLEVCVPLPLRSPRVRRIRNLSYGAAGRAQLLDLYVSRNPGPERRPVLIHFHGGHFERGGKSREALPLLHYLARRGWVCVSANYRLGAEGRFPNSLVDAKMVIAWIRSHATSYNLDASTVIVAGSSAGAHLATMAALTANDPRWQPGFEHDDTSVAGAICLYGYYGTRDDRALVSSLPETYLRRDSPPFFLAHGTNDILVPISDVDRFVGRLQNASDSPVVYARLPGALHSFDLLRSPRFESVIDGIEAFATRIAAI